MPQRIQEWSLQPCAAEAADRRALARVREKICEVQAALQKLEKRRASLDELCVFVKTLCIEETDEVSSPASFRSATHGSLIEHV